MAALSTYLAVFLLLLKFFERRILWCSIKSIMFLSHEIDLTHSEYCRLLELSFYKMYISQSSIAQDIIISKLNRRTINSYNSVF